MDDLWGSCKGGAHVLMLDVFQKLQLTVGPLRQYRRAKWLHDLLHCHGDACKLVLCRTMGPIFSEADKRQETITDQTRPNAPAERAGIRTEDNETVGSRTHSDGLEVNISSGDLGKGWLGWSGKRGVPREIREGNSPRMRSQRLRV